MMAETHSKSEVSTTTSTATSPTYAAPKSSSGISLCLQYFKTGPGIVKLVELVMGILCMACAAPAWTKGTHWFLFVVVTAFVSTSIWCFIYLLNLKNAINLPIDWLLTVFGVFNMLTYAVGSFYLYRDWKDSHPQSSFSGPVLKRNP
ncbi:hypothetical protein OTU49_004819 [Cherax quadricarinatus]|uniref:MARVEL domain-containing protein n=1 Tax=Cherax quadricarinatus TaxID=27406 RepID=A0AAW0XGJ6_CHEQU